MRIKSSKGISALESLPQVAMLLVFIGVAIGVGAYLNHEIATTSYTTTKVTNEAFTFTDNATYVKLAYPYIKSIEGVYNGTPFNTTNTINSGNYTFNEDSGIIITKTTCNGVDCKFNTTLRVNYTTWAGEEFLVSKNASSGLRNLSMWIPIIAVVISASVVIMVLMSSFRKDNF
jgi:hypothetical protein